jgi:hypothetical protein
MVGQLKMKCAPSLLALGLIFIISAGLFNDLHGHDGLVVSLSTAASILIFASVVLFEKSGKP